MPIADPSRPVYVSLLNFDLTEPVFRGCAGATYAHDEGCHRSMQTVSVNAGKSDVDIEINLVGATIAILYGAISLISM